MTFPSPKQSSLIPDMPRGEFLIDGKLNPVWQLYFSNMNSALKSLLSPEGFQLPSQTAANIATIESTAIADGTNISGTILYDSTNNKGVINENGTFKTITTS